jgi:hypothetical protein
MRWLAILCAVAGPVAADPKPPQAMCDPKVAVDRVEWICSAKDEPTVADTSVRREDGWHTSPERIDFNREENSHFDTWLADGLARLCKGEGSKEMSWASIHDEKWGWPLDGSTCRYGTWTVVLHKGKAHFALDEPRVDEIQAVQWLIHLHAFGINIVWNKAKPKTL